jgi:hypothetical protein
VLHQQQLTRLNEARDLYWVMGLVLTAEGRLQFKTNKVKEVVEMIEKSHTESEEGTFVPSRDMDELNYVLQSKEHPGCTRG